MRHDMIVSIRNTIARHNMKKGNVKGNDKG